MKTLLALSAVILLLALLFFRLQSESGLTELERCRTAVRQTKSWTVESTTQYSPSLVTSTTREKVSCPDDYQYLIRNRTPDDVITEQSTIHTQGVTYVETVYGKWGNSDTAANFQMPTECGKGPALVQMTVFNAIIELPRRKAGKIVKGQFLTIEGISCQEWSLDFGNEWPQTAPFVVCINPKTHLPRRITFAPGAANDFTGWNTTTVEPPPL